MSSRAPGHSPAWMDRSIPNPVAPGSEAAAAARRPHPIAPGSDAPGSEAAARARRHVPNPPLTFDAVYDAHFDFVWRSLRRLGIQPSRMDDAVQDVFLVVHRKLHEFEHRSSLRTWLFGIVRRVCHDYHRAHRRKDKATDREGIADPDALADEATPGPCERAEHAEAIRRFESLVLQVGEERRDVFVLAELEQMTAPEIAEALGIQTTTVYSRLRAARLEFEQALARQRGHEGGGHEPPE